MSTGHPPPSDPAPPCAAPDFAPRRPALALPDLACDCHAHVLGPASAYAFAAQRVYTPPDCVLADYRRMLAAAGITRAVLVQPSVYGDDNRLLLDTLKTDPDGLRGVAVVAPEVDDAELQRLHQAGVRGLRLNLVDRHDQQPRLPLRLLAAIGERIAPLGWHLELLAHVDSHVDELDALQALPVPVVLGHFGYQQPERGADAAGFQALLRLLRGGRTWVKLTGPYRLTRLGLPYALCDELAAALREAAPHRLLWGSDWPHVMLRGTMPNDADLVDLVARWLPLPAQRQQVLVDNPQALYGFGS